MYVCIYILFIVLGFELFYYPNLRQILYSFRDNIFPFIILIMCYKYLLEDKLRDDIYLSLVNIAKVFLVLGLILGIVEFINGWEWTSKFYAGYEFYGINDKINIKISHINGILRIPSLCSDNAGFGINSVICFFIVTTSIEKRNRFTEILYLAISFVNIYLSTSRTALIMIILYSVLYIILYKKNIKTIIFASLTLLMLLIIIFYNLSSEYMTKIFSVTSLFERIQNVWYNIAKNLTIKMIFIGKGSVNVGSAMLQAEELANNVESLFTYSFVDNAYIYYFICYGIIGIIIMGYFLFKYFGIKSNNLIHKYDKLYFILIICMLTQGFLVNFFQGRALSIFILLGVFRKRSKELCKGLDEYENT